MTRPTGNPALHRQRVKMALIPLLAVVLLAVIFWPAPADPPPPSGSVPDGAATTRVSLATSADDRSDSPTATVWPSMDLQTIAATNPFARSPAIARLFGPPRDANPPKPSPPPVSAFPADPRPPQVAAPARPAPAAVDGPPPLGNVQLQAIIDSAAGPVALIDSQIVYPGTRLPSGHRIIDITPTGIVIEYAGPDQQTQSPISSGPSPAAKGDQGSHG